jgi:hypothetical protein
VAVSKKKQRHGEHRRRHEEERRRRKLSVRWSGRGVLEVESQRKKKK